MESICAQMIIVSPYRCRIDAVPLFQDRAALRAYSGAVKLIVFVYSPITCTDLRFKSGIFFTGAKLREKCQGKLWCVMA